MPTNVNGRMLGVAENGVFTEANTDPIPGGRLWPEAALTWNAMRAEFAADGGDPDTFKPGGPNSSARTIAAQREFWANQPPPAAQPGTSNHGWGIAVDCPAASAQAWLLRRGHEFGWSHDEGARVGEPWHFRYVGASPKLLRRLQRDPLAGYTTSERRWIREYDALKRTGRDSARLNVLVRVMTEQRRRIWRAAQPPGRWTIARRLRYRSLKARTTRKG